jgi:hypothetical protein
MLHIPLVAMLLFAPQADADVPAEQEPAKDESGCTAILRQFRGMKLVEAKIEPESDLLRMVFYRKLNRHSVILFLIVRETCAGPYRIVDAKTIDPEPRECPPGSECI